MEKKRHLEFLRLANEVAIKARKTGNTPFGAVLVDENGAVIMEQGNAEHDLGDATAHAERVLASRASQSFSKVKLAKCTLYTTFEPCCMCTGAIYWANIGRIVYGVTESQLLEMTGSNEKNPTFDIPRREILSHGQKNIEVLGPFEEVKSEIVEGQKGFWD